MTAVNTGVDHRGSFNIYAGGSRAVASERRGDMGVGGRMRERGEELVQGSDSVRGKQRRVAKMAS